MARGATPGKRAANIALGLIGSGLAFPADDGVVAAAAPVCSREPDHVIGRGWILSGEGGENVVGVSDSLSDRMAVIAAQHPFRLGEVAQRPRSHVIGRG